MTFVYPILLGGLVLAGLPVLLHFLIRQKPKTLPFPAFRFLMLKRRSNTRNLRLRHLLLLLLRMALLILICLALARPRLFHEAIGLSREKPAALVLIFDTSPSMEYKSGEMTRLELAKKRSLELLSQLPEDGRVLILDASEPASFAREDWLKSLEKARQRIQSLTIRPYSTPVSKALDEALRRFDEWDRTGDDPAGISMPRFVCVFSDRTRASWDPSANTKRQAKEGDVKVQMLYFDVGIDDPVDLAITQVDLPAKRQSFTDGEKVPLRAVVKATGEKASNTMLVKIGKKTLAQAFNVDAGKQETLMLEIDTAGLGPGLHQAEVKLETATDALSFNNVWYLTFSIHAPQKVLVLADDVKKAQKFAWALEDLRYHVQLRNVQEKTDFHGYEAVFLVGVAAPPQELWQALKDYVEQGKGVGIIPPGEEMDRKAYNSAAAQKVMPARIVKKIDAMGGAWSLGQSDLGHPFMLPYRLWLGHGEYDFLQRTRVARYYWEVDPYKEKGITPVVKYDDAKYPPAIVERLAKGKVLLLTTTMDARAPAWNNYDENLTSFYLALTMMCGKHLCPAPANPTMNFQFGPEPPLVTNAPAQAFPKYLLSNGDFSEEIRFDDKNRWVGDRLSRAGNYTVSGTNPEKQETIAIHKFSINVPGEESDLTRVPIDEIEAVLGKDSLVPQDRNTSLADTLNWNEPMELFPWLMIGLLFLLALENLLANKFYRQEPAMESKT
jgi:hypothetical protein